MLFEVGKKLFFFHKIFNVYKIFLLISSESCFVCHIVHACLLSSYCYYFWRNLNGLRFKSIGILNNLPFKISTNHKILKTRLSYVEISVDKKLKEDNFCFYRKIIASYFSRHLPSSSDDCTRFKFFILYDIFESFLFSE